MFIIVCIFEKKIAIMRMMAACKDDMNPFVNQVMSRFTSLIYLVSRNPSNPRFNHYLFEAISGLVR
jgi:exportin-2 (importin alpha re-exporter)